MLERFFESLIPLVALAVAALAVAGAQIVWIAKLLQRQQARELAYRERIAAHGHHPSGAVRADG